MDDDTQPNGHPKCHCTHVVELKLKVSIAQWLVALALVGMFGLMWTTLGRMFSVRIVDSPTQPNSSERTFIDRVERERQQ